MKKYGLFLIASLLLIGATYTAKAVQKNWEFQTPESISTFDAISGKWDIVTVPKLDKPFLTQSVKYADYPKILAKDNFYDFEATTRLFISSENQDVQAGGLVLRYRNLFSFYMLIMNTKDKRITLSRSGLGGMKVVKRVQQELAPDQWYELRAKCYLDRIQASINGQLVLDAEDDTTTGGKVGLVTAGQSKVYFSGLTVNAETIEVAASTK